MSAQKFIIGFILSFLIGLSTVVLFVSYVDPYRTIEAPWSIPYVSDRNLAYKRLSLMKQKDYELLIVGSSTSEPFSPELIKKNFNTNSFLTGCGGASIALRTIFVRAGVKENKNLKKIIYVTDLFEFKDVDLINEYYFQPELRSYLDEEDMSWIKHLGPLARLESFVERKVIDRAFRTIKDYKEFQKGNFQSEFRSDGSTKTSMVFLETNEPFESRLHNSAISHKDLYQNMYDLNSKSIKMFIKTINRIRLSPNIQMHIVIPPVHSTYYTYFKSNFEKTNLYQKWVNFIKSQASSNIIIHDFSYPVYLTKGISDSETFWNDGVHLNGNGTNVILKDIYKK